MQCTHTGSASRARRAASSIDIVILSREQGLFIFSFVIQKHPKHTDKQVVHVVEDEQVAQLLGQAGCKFNELKIKRRICITGASTADRIVRAVNTKTVRMEGRK